jgi:hypothetical protein
MNMIGTKSLLVQLTDAESTIAQLKHRIGEIEDERGREIEELERELENERMKTAAIMTAATGHDEPPIDRDSPYWSVAYDDVRRLCRRMQADAQLAAQSETIVRLGREIEDEQGREIAELRADLEWVVLHRGFIYTDGMFDYYLKVFQEPATAPDGLREAIRRARTGE